jgi:hypothetical protein
MSGQSRLPARSRRYGVGKEIGGAIYLHRTYEALLGQVLIEAKDRLPADFTYTVVKYHIDTRAISFIHSPDFDTAPEPTVGDSWTVLPDGRTRITKQASDPYVYHHKWLFVRDDYRGFSVEESKSRSIAWGALPGIDKRRVGRKSYWTAEVLSRLTDERALDG